MISGLLVASKQGAMIAFGSAQISWTTGNINSAAVLINHGLNRVPKLVLANVRFTGSDPDNVSSVMAPQTSTFTPNTFYIMGRRATVSPQNYTTIFDWVAIG